MCRYRGLLPYPRQFLLRACSAMHICIKWLHIDVWFTEIWILSMLVVYWSSRSWPVLVSWKSLADVSQKSRLKITNFCCNMHFTIFGLSWSIIFYYAKKRPLFIWLKNNTVATQVLYKSYDVIANLSIEVVYAYSWSCNSRVRSLTRGTNFTLFGLLYFQIEQANFVYKEYAL